MSTFNKNHKSLLLALNLLLIFNLVLLPLRAENESVEFVEMPIEVVTEVAEALDSGQNNEELRSIPNTRDYELSGQEETEDELIGDQVSSVASTTNVLEGLDNNLEVATNSEELIEQIRDNSQQLSDDIQQVTNDIPDISSDSQSPIISEEQTTNSLEYLENNESAQNQDNNQSLDNNENSKSNSKIVDGNAIRQKICKKLGISPEDCQPTEEKNITTSDEQTISNQPATATSQQLTDDRQPADSAGEQATTTQDSSSQPDSNEEVANESNQNDELLGGLGDQGTDLDNENAGAESEISNNNGAGDNQAESAKEDNLEIESNNQSQIDNTQKITADSGQNILEYQGKGEGKIITGNAGTDTSSDLQTNTNDIETTNIDNPDVGGCTGCFVMDWQETSLAKNTNTGNKSDNNSSAEVLKNVSVINMNDTLINNDFDIFSNSGLNKILSGEKFKDGGIETGNVKAKTNILNLANTNLVDSLFKPLLLNVDDFFQGNINLWQFLLSQFGLNNNKAISSSVASNISTGDESENIARALVENNFEVKNINSGLIFNDLDIKAISGRNQILSGYKVKDTLLKTGEVEATTNLFNFLNLNLVKSEWVVAVINVFGDWVGDLVLPTVDDFFPEEVQLVPGGAGEAVAEIIGGNENQGDSINSALAVVTNDKEITNQNDGYLYSDVSARANSGKNEMNFSDKAQEVEIETGKSKTYTNFMSLANKSIIGGGWFSGFFNTFGQWAGEVVGLSNRSKAWGSDESFVVSDDRPEFSPIPLSGQGDAVAQIIDPGNDSVNKSTAEYNSSFKVDNQNEGVIVNKVNIEADSGTNNVAAVKGTKTKIKTGNVKAATNISNFLNVNLVGTKVVTFALNIFGNWKGNVVFGKEADLAVSMSVKNAAVELLEDNSNDEIEVEIKIENKDEKNEMAGKLGVSWDSGLELVDDTNSAPSGLTESEIELPELKPKEIVSFDLKFKLKQDAMSDKGKFTIFSKVEPNGADSNQNNNQTEIEVNANENQQQEDNFSGSGNEEQQEGEEQVEIAVEQDRTDTTEQTASNAQGSGSSQNYEYAHVMQPREYVTVIKTNDANGVLKYGSKVNFKIVIKNNSGYNIKDMMFFDKFIHLNSGQTIFENSQPLESLGPYEKITVDYEITIDEKFPYDGRYRNTAYAQGIFEGSTLNFNHSSSEILIDTDGFTAQTKFSLNEPVELKDSEIKNSSSTAGMIEGQTNSNSTPEIMGEIGTLENSKLSTEAELLNEFEGGINLEITKSRSNDSLTVKNNLEEIVLGLNDKVFTSDRSQSNNKFRQILNLMQTNFWWVLVLVFMLLVTNKTFLRPFRVS